MIISYPDFNQDDGMEEFMNKMVKAFKESPGYEASKQAKPSEVM